MKRTALVTAASVAAVVLTGTAAVGANIGILSSADDSPVGELNATTELATTPVEVVVEVPTAESSSTPSSEPASTPRVSPAAVDVPGSSVRTEAFVVDQAGTVVVVVDGRTVRVESVEPAPGWSWIPDDDIADDTLDVRFDSGSEILVLEVELLADGTLRAEIDRPQSAVVPTRPAIRVDDDDDHDDDQDEYEDDDDRDDDDRDDEYEDDDRDDHDRDDEYEDDDDRDDHDDDDHADDHDDEHEGRDDDD